MLERLRAEELTLVRQKKIICSTLSFSLKAGEFWGLLGSNGRGKTTLLHTLAGLIFPLKGRIFIENADILYFPRKQFARKLGLLLQDEIYTFPTTVKDSLLAARYPYKKEENHHGQLDEILTLLNLTHLVNRSLLQLSGGERRRVSVGRIWLQQPDIYLLDEPTHHLDPVYRHNILSTFKKLCTDQGCTVMMAGHDLSVMLEHCDHFLLLMQAGDIMAGPACEVLNDDNLQGVYGHQFNAITLSINN